MHWAAHGHTAAELIVQRVDAQAPNMGLTNWTGANRGAPVRKADVGIAKNYLNADELDTLNRIVTAYIEVAELQAQARQPMTMRDWAQELDNFLRLTRKDILAEPDAGRRFPRWCWPAAQWGHDDYSLNVANLPMAELTSRCLRTPSRSQVKQEQKEQEGIAEQGGHLGERIMNARVLNAVTGRLSLRPPQEESLKRLARALEASPDLLGHERDVSAILSTLKAEFPRWRTSSASFRRCVSRWPRAWARRA